MPPVKQFTVFFSGTRRDLPGFWEAALGAIAQHPRFRPLAMEDAEPEGIPPAHWSRKKATIPDVLVILVGDFYGNTVRETGRSLTEEEFDAARQMGLEPLVFRTHASDRALVEAQSATAKAAMREFHFKIDSSVFRVKISTPEEFARDVVRSLEEWERRSFRGTTLGAEDYFAPLLQPGRIAGHQEALIGRDDTIAVLDAFERSDRRVLLLLAPWGQGKSRVLLEWGRVPRPIATGPIRFVRNGINPTRQDLELSASDPCVLVLEDVHRRAPALPALLDFLIRSAPAVKLVATTRPSGEEEFNRALRTSGFEAGDISRLVLLALDEISHREVIKNTLAGDDEAAYRIYQRTRGSVLAGVLAARLVRRGTVSIANIESSPDFEFSVLQAFKDSLLDEAEGNAETRRWLERLLTAVAAAAPIGPEIESHVQTLATFLEEKPDRVRAHLETLEDAGLIIRGGKLVTLAVDGIADLLLSQACIRKGMSTGYAEKVFRAFWEVFGGNVLRNLGAVQWKAGQAGLEVRLLDKIWPELDALYRTLPVTGRISFLRMVEQVAPFEPVTVLTFLRKAMGYGLGPPEELELVRGLYTMERIHDQMARVVVGTLYDPTLVREACDLLWSMAEADTRDSQRYTDSAEKTLREIGTYRPGHPLSYLEAFITWLEKRSSGDGRIPGARLANYIAPVLSKNAMHIWFDGRQMTMSATGIAYAAVRAIRQRALDLLSRIAEEPDRTAAGQAARVLGEVLTPPAELFGRVVTPEEHAQWEEEQIDGIARLRAAARRQDNRGFDICVLGELHWVVSHAPSRRVRSRASRLTRTLRNRINGSLEQAVVRSYAFGHDVSGKVEQEHQADLQAFALQLSKERPDPADLRDRITSAWQNLKNLGLDPEPVPLLIEVTKQDPELASRLGNAILQNPESPLAGGLHGIIDTLFDIDLANGTTLLERALTAGSTLALCSTAAGLRISKWSERLGEATVIKHFRALLMHPDESVRARALWNIGFAAHLSGRARASLLLGYDLAAAPQTGETWAGAMMPGGKVYDQFTPPERKNLAKKLRDLRDLGHWTVELMARLARDAPEELADSVLFRLEQPRKPGEDLDVVPSVGQGNPFHGLPRTTRLRMMTELGMLLQGESGVVAYDARRLFAQLAESDPQLVSGVRRSWVESGEAKLILQAAESFGEEEPETLFTEREFVIALIRAASTAGAETLKDVQGTLGAVAHNGLRQSSGGEPSPRDIDIRDRARRTAGELPEGSPERATYTMIAQDMDDWITRLDQEERDRRHGS